VCASKSALPADAIAFVVVTDDVGSDKRACILAYVRAVEREADSRGGLDRVVDDGVVERRDWRLLRSSCSTVRNGMYLLAGLGVPLSTAAPLVAGCDETVLRGVG
jgi:hypothetical protein